MENWIIIRNKNPQCKEGYPFGEILCQKKEWISEILKNSEMDQPEFFDYLSGKKIEVKLEEKKENQGDAIGLI